MIKFRRTRNSAPLRRRLKDGMISVAGNLYSVPDYTRRRSADVQQHPMEIRIFEEGQLIARHPVLEGKSERRIDPSHRKAPLKECGGITTLLGILRCSGPTHGCRGGSVMTAISTRITSNLVGLRMPRALEVLDHVFQRLEVGEITAVEALDELLNEEFISRERRRVSMALMTARLAPIKTMESFDFTFQPSLDRNRIMALAELEFITRCEVIHLLGPPGTGKSHLAVALGVTAVRAGKSVYRATLAELIDALIKAEREGLSLIHI